MTEAYLNLSDRSISTANIVAVTPYSFSAALTKLYLLLLLLQIMKNAAETLIPVTLELGGKDAFIVCEDVDVPHV